MTTHERAVQEAAMGLKVRVGVLALKRLAQETSETFDMLVRNNVPDEAVRAYFILTHMHDRIVDAEQRGGIQPAAKR